MDMVLRNILPGCTATYLVALIILALGLDWRGRRPVLVALLGNATAMFLTAVTLWLALADGTLSAAAIFTIKTVGGLTSTLIALAAAYFALPGGIAPPNAGLSLLGRVPAKAWLLIGTLMVHAAKALYVASGMEKGPEVLLLIDDSVAGTSIVLLGVGLVYRAAGAGRGYLALAIVAADGAWAWQNMVAFHGHNNVVLHVAYLATLVVAILTEEDRRTASPPPVLAAA